MATFLSFEDTVSNRNQMKFAYTLVVFSISY